MSRVNKIGIVRLLSLPGDSLAAVCVLAGVVAGCTPWSATSLCDAIASGPSSVERSACSAPRFSEGGPDAEKYGASKGYPIGDRSTCLETPFLVGSHSHFDQIFEGRVCAGQDAITAARASGGAGAALRVRGRVTHPRRLPRA